MADAGEHAIAHAAEDVIEHEGEDLVSQGAKDLVTHGADEGAGDDAARAVEGGECPLSFAASTLVATPHGAQAIGSLKVGDQVTAYDPATGKPSPQTVQHVWINHDHDLLDVTLHVDAAPSPDAVLDKAQRVAVRAHDSQAPPTDETIRTTANHPWLTADRGWVLAVARQHPATTIGTQWTGSYDAASDLTCRAPRSATTGGRRAERGGVDGPAALAAPGACAAPRG